jgi:hypothetical protein
MHDQQPAKGTAIKALDSNEWSISDGQLPTARRGVHVKSNRPPRP